MVRPSARLREIIVHAGSNICPQEVEEVLCRHPAVERAAVVGVTHSVEGATTVAFVQRRQDLEEVSSDDLKAFCVPLLAAYKIPERFVFVEDLPVNDGGKTDRIALTKLL